MTDPAVPDLHALAVEALSTMMHPTLGAHGTLRTYGGRAWFRPTTPDEFIDAVLAAIEPELERRRAAHRAMVLHEAADAIENITGSLVCDWTKGEALASIRDLATTGPPARQDGPGTTGQATAVPEAGAGRG